MSKHTHKLHTCGTCGITIPRTLAISLNGLPCCANAMRVLVLQIKWRLSPFFLPAHFIYYPRRVLFYSLLLFLTFLTFPPLKVFCFLTAFGIICQLYSGYMHVVSFHDIRQRVQCTKARSFVGNRYLKIVKVAFFIFLTFIYAAL